MTKQSDLKRLVRARMKKTGESYATARMHIVAKQGADPGRPPVSEYADIAGMRDEAVRAKTDRTWREWVEALDAVDAHTLSHAEIATHLREALGVGSWWAQAVTGGYERIRGLRQKNQRREGSFDANKSKTFAVPVARLFRMFAEASERARWLVEAEPTVSSTKAPTSVRFDWDGQTRVQAWFVDKGPTKSSVQIQHSRLPSAEAVDVRKRYWAERLAQLAIVLAE